MVSSALGSDDIGDNMMMVTSALGLGIRTDDFEKHARKLF